MNSHFRVSASIRSNFCFPSPQFARRALCQTPFPKARCPTIRLPHAIGKEAEQIFSGLDGGGGDRGKDGGGGGGGGGGGDDDDESTPPQHNPLPLLLSSAVLLAGPPALVVLVASATPSGIDTDSSWFGARGIFASPMDGRTVPLVPILSTTAVAAGVLVANKFLGLPLRGLSPAVLGFIAFPLGLFQGFRFNNMYNNRYLKAKGSMMALRNNVIGLGHDAIVLIGPSHRLTRRIVGLLEALALEAASSIAGHGSGHSHEHRGSLPHLHAAPECEAAAEDALISEPDLLKGLQAAPYRVDYLAGEVLRCIHKARRRGLLDESEAQCLRSKLSAAKDGLGGCLSIERGVTPAMVPIHVRTLLMTYCSALPCTTYGSLGVPDSLFVPVHMFVNYAILGIESCAGMLETPFGIVKCAGHHTYVIDAHAELLGARTKLRQLYLAAGGQV